MKNLRQNVWFVNAFGTETIPVRKIRRLGMRTKTREAIWEVIILDGYFDGQLIHVHDNSFRCRAADFIENFTWSH